MLTLGHPWLLLLLLLPLIVRALPAHAERRWAVRTAFFGELAGAAGQRPSSRAVVLRRNLWQIVLLPLVWLLVVLALARPQWVGDPIERVESTRDLMLVVDLSGSMQVEDFVDAGGHRIDRLTAVKGVLRDFVAERSSDRLGLVLFGQAAFLQVPFTLDHDVFLRLLDETSIGMAGPRTMMGDAIGLAIRAFEASEVEEKVAVVLTDGNDTGSKVPPIKAAEIAAREGITLYTIGVGDPAAAGESPLDEKTLLAVASSSGGEFFRAENRQELTGVYRRLDELEPVEIETTTYRPTLELYHWPLGLALVLVLAYHLTMATVSTVAGLRARRVDA